MADRLEAFVRESNRIEGIDRDPTAAELDAHRAFLVLPYVRVADLQAFVTVVQPGARLRGLVGLNVTVGDYRPPPGGPQVLRALKRILAKARVGVHPLSPYGTHQAYEGLHPFTDGNGRSGRVLWLWQMGGLDRAPLGFLHTWYYQSLQAHRTARG